MKDQILNSNAYKEPKFVYVIILKNMEPIVQAHVLEKKLKLKEIILDVNAQEQMLDPNTMLIVQHVTTTTTEINVK